MHVFGCDVNRVWIEVGQYLWDGFIHQRVDVYVVDILVVDDVQQVVEPVAARVDDVKPVAREVVCIESANHNAECNAHGHEQGHVSVSSVRVHSVLD